MATGFVSLTHITLYSVGLTLKSLHYKCDVSAVETFNAGEDTMGKPTASPVCFIWLAAVIISRFFILPEASPAFIQYQSKYHSPSNDQ